MEAICSSLNWTPFATFCNTLEISNNCLLTFFEGSSVREEERRPVSYG